MIGTGKVKGDIIYFDLSEVSTTGYAKKLTRSASAVTSFGSGATMKPMAGTVKQLNKRRQFYRKLLFHKKVHSYVYATTLECTFYLSILYILIKKGIYITSSTQRNGS